MSAAILSEMTWRGKALADCDRDELLACIAYLAKIHAEHFSADSIRAAALGRVEMLKRGEVTG
jgi:hypothetical protein